MRKRTRLLIVGLMLIAITGASTLAYFTSGVELGTSKDGNLKLQITNGIVEITEASGDSYSPIWTYAVAEGAGDKDRSPDISGFDGTKSVSNEADDKLLERLDIGSKLIINGSGIGVVGNARPGDALLLSSSSDAINSDGLIVENNSNLTIKCKVELTTDASSKIASLLNGGWQLLINDDRISKTEDISTALSNLSSKITSDLNSGKTSSVKIKLELPLNTNNTYQGDTPNGTISSFEIGKIFSITATQENNPGWDEEGN